MLLVLAVVIAGALCGGWVWRWYTSAKNPRPANSPLRKRYPRFASFCSDGLGADPHLDDGHRLVYSIRIDAIDFQPTLEAHPIQTAVYLEAVTPSERVRSPVRRIRGNEPSEHTYDTWMADLASALMQDPRVLSAFDPSEPGPSHARPSAGVTQAPSVG